MFSTFKERLILGVFILLILSIPVGAYLVAQNQTIKSSASEPKKPSPTLIPLPSEDTSIAPLPSASPSSEPTPSTTIATSVGPTLSLKVNLEGRTPENQVTKLFVGIMEGTLIQNPRFLLSFTLNLPANGEYSNLSLAGLNPGSTYTALLKGSSQIATSSAFTMSPSNTSLQPLNLISGDLNDDNVINSTDYSIAQKIFGTTPESINWNENADINKDKIINSIDLAIIAKNVNQTGASGSWNAPLATATSSASLNTPAQGGYWIWVPK